jgi:hypothetical protein
MAYAKLGISNITVPAKALYLRRLAAGVTNNPNFSAASPTPAELIAQADGLEVLYNEAHAARLASKSKTSELDLFSAAADLLVANLASYVDAASKGDAQIIETSGFAVRSTPTPVGELPAPTDLQVTPSEFAGSADVKWKSTRGAVSFTVERAEDATNLDYAVIGNCTQKQVSLNSMVSGKKYWFRVAAIGSAGQSAWSDPVPLFAP